MIMLRLSTVSEGVGASLRAVEWDTLISVLGVK